MLEKLTSLVPLAVTVTAVASTLWGVHWLLIKRHPNLGNDRQFPRQLIMLGLTLLGILASVFALPISEGSRNQLMGLIGILISGVFAFASTTVFSNLMAGVLLRITKPFRVGDFIRIGDHFGRVSESGLFETEIQTETRELISFPNTFCISNPVTTIRSSGTIITASLSLGYDLDHRHIETLLIQAARVCGLSEPFVHILELGNFSVTYRVSGFLEDPKKHLISARSNLHACVLDTLHSNHIEIMSPAFMNQRKISDTTRIIPPATSVATVLKTESSAEDIAFDKAEQAEQLENEKDRVHKELERLTTVIANAASEEERVAAQAALEKMHQHLASLEEEPRPPAPDDGRSEPDTAPAGAGDSVSLHPQL